MKRLVSTRIYLTTVASLIAFSPLWADTGLERIDKEIADMQLTVRNSVDRPASGRARYMACGYVAPGSTHREEAKVGGDVAFAQMLERLRTYLRRLTENP